ncbi:IclR family transcriptional regulator [Oceanispirochaeta sp.]|jgi:IclR family KDG regulon transcriptional repressor|uniref:IclR family transcriptional regulator n=1 Tax=Oceanispirochaeta sp. TaxID=2035350 RepID=UPI0026386DF0|nr:IclR family transcriptional regulator [Oceanispirochaeta sp.]MDA3955628.1 IclR family transcriptional regulator [Oceanispirochaeta sp.]
MAVQILDKSFLVLETLSREITGLTVSELSKRVDLNITTVHRILGTFADRGYIRQDQDKRYCLSLKFIELSSSYLNGLDLKQIAEPFLKDLTSSLKETVFLATLMDNQAVYIDKHEIYQNLRCYTVLGERKPLYCTALGKSLLLGFNEKELNHYFETCEFEVFTEFTITDKNKLRKELKISSARGWTVDDEEAVPGLICFAAPIFDYRGHIIASVSTSFNKEDLQDDDRIRITDQLLEVSGKISKRMGYKKQEKIK